MRYSSTCTWHLHDVLGSVRLGLDDAGTLLPGDLAYSPFGLPQSGATPDPFGVVLEPGWEHGFSEHP
jgi:hypothetical protein